MEGFLPQNAKMRCKCLQKMAEMDEDTKYAAVFTAKF